MCLLSTKPANVKWDIEHLKKACVSNKDGWGLIGIKEERLWWNKGTTVQELETALPFYQDVQAMFHARWATHGANTSDQIHPYRVAGDIYMAHNGIFNIDTPDKTKSDTWHMARKLGSLGYEKLLGYIQNKTWLDEYTKLIGSNKVSFISPKFGIITANESLGHIIDGVWMSNYSYKSYVYDRGGQGSFGFQYLHLSPDDMLESWMSEQHPYSLISGDLDTNRFKAIDAVILLMKKYKELEEESLDMCNTQAIGESFRDYCG